MPVRPLLLRLWVRSLSYWLRREPRPAKTIRRPALSLWDLEPRAMPGSILDAALLATIPFIGAIESPTADAGSGNSGQDNTLSFDTPLPQNSWDQDGRSFGATGIDGSAPIDILGSVSIGSSGISSTDTATPPPDDIDLDSDTMLDSNNNLLGNDSESLSLDAGGISAPAAPGGSGAGIGGGGGGSTQGSGAQPMGSAGSSPPQSSSPLSGGSGNSASASSAGPAAQNHSATLASQSSGPAASSVSTPQPAFPKTGNAVRSSRQIAKDAAMLKDGVKIGDAIEFIPTIVRKPF